jgi:hypothetical protein
MRPVINYITNSKPLSEGELLASDALFSSPDGVLLCDSNVFLSGRVNNTSLMVFQGDITTLRVDAIMNAANSQGLGCFTKGNRFVV